MISGKRDTSDNSRRAGMARDGWFHDLDEDFSRLNLDQYPELHDIIEDAGYECPEPDDFCQASLMQHINQVYQSNRGAELGTVRVS